MSNLFSYTDQWWSALVVAVDLLLIGLLYQLLEALQFTPDVRGGLLLLLLCYMVVLVFYPPAAHKRFVKAATVATRCFWVSVCIAAIFVLMLFVLELQNEETMHLWMIAVDWLLLALCLFGSRMTTRALIYRFRQWGAGNRRVVFVGAGHNLRHLYENLTGHHAAGFRIKGYFDDSQQNQFTDVLPKLGDVQDLIPYLKKQPVDVIFCNLTSRHDKEILEIMNYCENHLIRFYSVPNVRNYVHHVMAVDMVEDMPVLTLRDEPLMQPLNRIVKRAFDIIFSLLFLICIFPFVWLFSAIGIKLSSKGPVFFKQKRTGIRGEEFVCYKFRSMHLNKEADTLQCTEHDPRKFPFGDFLRRSNLDEMPQFINVLRGEMSIVGPRPHMLKHTEEYSALVDKYMVRHWAKPGITGWAQVNGARGETEHLWQMEDRIKKDVWYIENYSFMLDMQIILLTIKTIVKHDEHAY